MKVPKVCILGQHNLILVSCKPVVNLELENEIQANTIHQGSLVYLNLSL